MPISHPFPSFPTHQPFLQGTTASSIHGTRLGFGEFGGETHASAPDCSQSHIELLAQSTDQIVFHSWNQLHHPHQPYRLAAKKFHTNPSEGLRLNPGYSAIPIPLHNPCRTRYRQGIPLNQIPNATMAGSGWHSFPFIA